MPGSTTLHLPPGMDRAALLAPLNSAALEHSPEYRRAITRTSPTLFALTYMLEHLSSDATGGQVSFSELHVDMARAARRWIRDDLAPGEVRDAWIAPRESAKSSWLTLILPTWALAHGHRGYVQAFMDADGQARQHLASFRDELDGNELLQRDFPELCLPAQRRGTGRATSDRAQLYVARSGAAFAARGIEASTLGAKIGSRRPDLLLLDDIEPDASSYDAGTRERRLSAISSKILPMAQTAVVQWAATTTSYGSLAHDLVLHALGRAPTRAAWIDEVGFAVRYYSAIVVGDDGRERSLWPQRWSLEWLQGQRHTRAFAMNYACIPPEPENGWWSERVIVVDEAARPVRRALWVDPAVTSTSRSDFTGLAVVGQEAGVRPRCVVEWVRQVRVSPEQLRTLIGSVLERNPGVRQVFVEVNQGGSLWDDVLGPLRARFPGLEIVLHRAVERKMDRLTRLLDWYEQGRVVHGRVLPALTDQLLAYPDVANDDLADAVAAGVEHWLGERESTR